MKKKKLEDCKSFDEIEDNDLVSEFINSNEFKERLRKRVEKDTWGKGLPMVYMDADGWLVRHWKDGKIDRIKKLK